MRCFVAAVGHENDQTKFNAFWDTQQLVHEPVQILVPSEGTNATNVFLKVQYP